MANLITLIRTVGSVVVGLLGISTHTTELLLVAYAIYWLGDMADGWFARHLDQETRLGAVFDIVADRLCAGVLCVGMLIHIPSAWPVLAVFLCSFMVLDSMLSMAFLCWPLLSPNYFGAVDRTVYRLNWSPVAKALNTSVVVALVLLGLPWAGLAVALVIAAVKVWSAHRVLVLLGAW